MTSDTMPADIPFIPGHNEYRITRHRVGSAPSYQSGTYLLGGNVWEALSQAPLDFNLVRVEAWGGELPDIGPVDREYLGLFARDGKGWKIVSRTPDWL